MRSGAQILLGFFAAVLSALIVFGAMAAALAETGVQTALVVTDTPQPATLVSQPGGFTPAPTSSPFPTPTFTPPPSCPPPAGWIPVVAGLDDSLSSLAQAYPASVEEIREGNCLPGDSFQPGSVLYLPPVPPTGNVSPSPTAGPTQASAPPTRTSVPCGPPPGWVRYRVQAGDTLSRLSSLLGGIGVSRLQQANCLGASTLIRGGSLLWVPYLPATRTPLPSPVATTTMLPSPTFTQAPPTAIPPTPTAAPDTFTATPPPPTATIPVEPPTDTALPPTATSTAVPPTNTAMPPTVTSTPVPPTNTPPPTLTSTPMPTQTPAPPPTETGVTLAPPEVTIAVPTTPPVQE